MTSKNKKIKRKKSDVLNKSVKKSSRKRNAKKSQPKDDFASIFKNQVSKNRKKKSSRGSLVNIKVIGIGGGGSSMSSRIMESTRIKGAEFISINTDLQALEQAVANRKIYIGKALTKGMGAGMNPEIGKQATEENRSEISEALDGADIVFVVAGMGGGTGTAGAPVVADIAKEKGALTIAMVTKPFGFEGPERMSIAQDGINRLKEIVDSLIVIPNDRVFSVISKETSINKAFGYIDEVIKNGIQAISELINIPGLINVDFADIKSTMKDSGTTLIGCGIASGQDRSIKAVESAIISPFIETSIHGARGVLFCIAGGKDLRMNEVNDVAKAISSNLDSNSRVIFGAYHERGLKDKAIKITVIATNFNESFSQIERRLPAFSETAFPEKSGSLIDKATTKKKEDLGDIKMKMDKDEKKTEKKEDGSEPWDIPAFLRKKKK